MKIISWNLNSIRARKEQLLQILKKKNLIFCLQETKVTNQSFPEEQIKKLNYFIFKNGMASYNGVAILSRYNIENYNINNFCGKSDCRHIELIYKKIKIHSIYVPAGGDEPNLS